MPLDLPSPNDASAQTAYITEAAHRLKGLSQTSRQHNWHHTFEPYPPSAVLNQQTWRGWPIAPLNNRGHVAWPRGQQSLWLCQQITVPEALQGFAVTGLTLRLGLTWWAHQAYVYVDGQLVQAGDLFDYFTRSVLSDRATPGETFTVTLHLVSPGHDDGALVATDILYEAPAGKSPEPGFVADELTTLMTYAGRLAPEKLLQIAQAVAPLDWSAVSQRDRFQAELAALRQRLLPLSPWIKQRHMACTGHAHLDLAWLWPIEDTWQAAERTFRSVFALQESFPELTYTHSSPALFDWLETHRPQLFQAVVQAVKAGTWSIDGGLWVEPELNTLGGESLTRQILYGQHHTRSRFGAISPIAWLPDSFGFSWQLPQLLTLGGMEYFATQKLRWNDTTPFPHHLFWWQGLDGTQILSVTLPPIGSDIAPVAMATHGAEWEASTERLEALWLPGMGDHGGGPTRDMLEKARRWAGSPFFPQLKFTSVVEHLKRLTQPETAASAPADRTSLPGSSAAVDETVTPLPSAGPWPTWHNELYLELHRGCYTVHADQKWFNRRCEDTLREAELFSTLAHRQGLLDYPRAALEQAWKQMLFNQFHDILPGTAIPEVFVTANQSWQAAYGAAQALRHRALAAIAQQIPFSTPPTPAAIAVSVFNSLNWERTDIVEIALDTLPALAQTWRVLDAATQAWVPCQVSQFTDYSDQPPGQSSPAGDASPRLLFSATVPSVGYRVFWLIADPEAQKLAIPYAPYPTPQPPPWHLENIRIKAVINPTTGHLTELWDKATQVNLVDSAANQLQAFQDAGQYWDAWDIAPDYRSHPLPAARLKSISCLEQGPVRQRIRVVHELADSTVQQDYVLDQPSPYLKVATVADWHATQVVLKAAFPLAIAAEYATYEIPFGAIARPTTSTDPHEQAKWEVPGLRWADISNDTVGFSLLTDYKHGFDAQPQQLRLTLLKAPLWPDPQADRGQHQFTYALYPHGGDWRQGKTPQQALAFNTPLVPVLRPDIDDGPSQPPLTLHPYSASFLDLGTDRVHLSALKLAETDPGRWVLRCWDMYGQGTTLNLQTPWGRPSGQRIDLLERELSAEPAEQIMPWQIATLAIHSFSHLG